VSEDKLDQLLLELNHKLDERLQEIELTCQSQIALVEKEVASDFDVRVTKLKQDNMRRLAQIKVKLLRDAKVKQQQTLWDCQRRCIEMVLERCREMLVQKPLDNETLQCWVKEARSRLQETEMQHLKLKLKPEWVASLVLNGIKVEAAPLLGGAILENTARHIEVDGSWDQRLALLTPELWQRWYQLVSENH